MQFSPPSCHFIPFWSKYPSQHNNNNNNNNNNRDTKVCRGLEYYRAFSFVLDAPTAVRDIKKNWNVLRLISKIVVVKEIYSAALSAATRLADVKYLSQYSCQRTAK
jgi:hypothetical protein